MRTVRFSNWVTVRRGAYGAAATKTNHLSSVKFDVS